ncbi:MAG TPA: glycosyltransferase family 2 protein [Bryobacteraceae bacterium]|jgi:dolichol-phosphate mannosyltransferase
MTLISIVVPTHNEILNVPILYKHVAAVFEKLSGYDFELIFSDDSTDTTPQVIHDLHQADSRVKLVRLSRRFGQSIAIAAGIDCASGDAVVIMDADLQDPPEILPEMIDRWRQGYEVIYVQRANASTSRSYRAFAFVFYRLLRSIASIEIPVDAGEFRFLDRKVVEYLKKLTEHTRYMRGLTMLPGFRQTSIRIQRSERLQGQTNYNFKRSVLVALDGILSFSTLPLRLGALLGFVITALGLVAGVVHLAWRLVDPAISGPGWPILIAVLIVGGLQLLVMGIIGEYLARIFVEVQNRPVYWVDYKLGFDRLEATASQK